MELLAVWDGMHISPDSRLGAGRPWFSQLSVGASCVCHRVVVRTESEYAQVGTQMVAVLSK